MIKPKQFIVLFFTTIIAILLLVMILTIYIDPYFQYHAPLDNYTYTINMPRYQNHGILRHFEYDAMITGNSLTECFKASELEELFQVKAVKTAYGAGNYKEIDHAVRTAINHNEELKMVVRGLDLQGLMNDKDSETTEAYIPYFLYDDFVWNDIEYLFNRDVFFDYTMSILITNGTNGITDFDEYSNWSETASFGPKVIGSGKYVRGGTKGEEVSMTEEDYIRISENIMQNVVNVVHENPNVEFYYFIPPYSILYWENSYSTGTIDIMIEAQRMLIEALLPYDNCKLFTYNDQYAIITNLYNYRDTIHYTGDINSYMLQAMAVNEGILTADNYEEYLVNTQEFYKNYDYDRLFDEGGSL